MVLNKGKRHYTWIGKDIADKETLEISSRYQMSNNTVVEIFGTTIDRKLTFNQHIKNTCKTSTAAVDPPAFKNGSCRLKFS